MRIERSNSRPEGREFDKFVGNEFERRAATACRVRRRGAPSNLSGRAISLKRKAEVIS
ncbi:hypothetical protein [Kaarinaea lacus]